MSESQFPPSSDRPETFILPPEGHVSPGGGLGSLRLRRALGVSGRPVPEGVSGEETNASDLPTSEQMIPPPHDATEGAYQSPAVIIPGIEDAEALASQKAERPEELESEQAIRTDIERLSEGVEKQERQASVQGELGRLNRNLTLARVVESLKDGGSLDEREKQMVSGALESRGWHGLFTKLHSGDGLAVFLAPSGRREGIKYMNDVLFGPQRTDRVIEFRRTLIRRELDRVKMSQAGSNYKAEYYRIPSEENQEDVREALERISRDVREEMTAFLVEEAIYAMEDADPGRKWALADFLNRLLGPDGAEAALVQSGTIQTMHRAYQTDLRRRAAAGAIALHVDRDPSEIAIAQRFVHEYEDAALECMRKVQERVREDIVIPALKDPQRGYRVTYGTAIVGEAEGEESYVHIERAVSEATKGAIRAGGTEACGAVWSPETMEQHLGEWRALRTELEGKYLTDQDGRTYPLFGKRGDGTVELNADVIRLMRKEAFVPQDDQKNVAESVLRYTRLINILDVLKPFVHEEFAGGAVYGDGRTIREQVAWTDERVQAIRSGKGLDQEARSAIAEEIRREGKDHACTSVMEFHRQALEISECTYVHLDAIDVGVRLLQEFELLLQRVERGEMTFDEAQLVAGDTTTAHMRAFRADISRAYGEATGGDRPIMLVGGDEVLLAMDRQKATDDLVLKLQTLRFGGTSGARVIKIAVSESDRTSFVSEQDEFRDGVKLQHVKAQRLMEAGSERAKEIEHGLRETVALIASLPIEEREGYESSLRALNLDHVAIRQASRGDAFEIIVREPDAEARVAYESCESALKRIRSLQSSIRERVTALRSELLSMPGVNESNASEALYRKNRLSPEGFATWLKERTS